MRNLGLLLVAILAVPSFADELPYTFAGSGSDSSFNLHNHTYCSDGSDTPESIVALAKKLGIHTFAVTDHDTVGCVARAQAAAAQAGIRLIPGIEISAEDDSMHILGLGIDPSNAGLVDLMKSNEASRLQRARDTVAKLAQLKDDNGQPIKITFSDVLIDKINFHLKAEGKPTIDGAGMSEDELLKMVDAPLTRPDIAFTLVRLGYVPDAQAAFSRYLGDGGAASSDLAGPGFAKVIAAIHGAGGLAVLAHPHTIYKFHQPPYHFSGKDYSDFDTLLKDMLAAGLDGIEQYKNGHGPTNWIVDIARQYGQQNGKTILLTPGSDYHGSSGVGQPVLDALAIPKDEAARIEDALDKLGK